MKILLLVIVIAVLVGLFLLARRGPASRPPSSSPQAQPGDPADPDGPGFPDDNPGVSRWDRPD